MKQDQEKLERSFAYIRVSTALQEEKGTQENQEKAIKKYAKSNTIEIVEYFYDLGFSGNLKDRPKLNEMLSRLNEVDSIVVYDTSRLSRNFEHSMNIFFKFKEFGKNVHVVAESNVIDSSSETSQLIGMLKSWFNSYERKKIKERQKIGIDRFREKNGRWGRKKKAFSLKRYKALREKKVSKASIARIFEMARSTLYKRLAELGIDD